MQPRSFPEWPGLSRMRVEEKLAGRKAWLAERLAVAASSGVGARSGKERSRAAGQRVAQAFGIEALGLCDCGEGDCFSCVGKGLPGGGSCPCGDCQTSTAVELVLRYHGARKVSLAPAGDDEGTASYLVAPIEFPDGPLGPVGPR